MNFQKSIIPFTRVIFSLIFLLAFSQCKKPDRSALIVNPAFTEKIAAFTSGVISSESVIQVILAEDYPGGDISGAPSGDGLFRFKPAIRGQAVWVDKRTIEFRPSQKLPSGENYSGKFFLSKILQVPKEIAVLEFSFSVVEQEFTVEIEGYQSHNENDLVWNRISGTVNTADVIDTELLGKYFSAKQDNRNLTINWEAGSDRRSFAFTVDSVQRKESPASVEINWDGTPEFKHVKGNQQVEIPALSDYKVMDVKVVQQPEQYIQLQFSDPVKKNQNFEGLIFLENNTSLEFSVAGNTIKVFPAARQTGDNKITIRSGLVNILGYGLKQDHVSIVSTEHLLC